MSDPPSTHRTEDAQSVDGRAAPIVAAAPALRPLDRALRPFADVRNGEGVTALLLALNVFLILMAYYVLKPVREALILGEATAELKTYLSGVEVVVLALIVPGYGRLVKSLDRRRLINTVTGFFVLCLVGFYGLGRLGVPFGIVFFLWIGIFSMMTVSLFWSFANDVYTKEEGERLFPIVGFGASLGAVVGAALVRPVVHWIGVFELFLIGAALLVVEVLITNWIDRRQKRRRDSRTAAETVGDATPRPPAAVSAHGAFALVFKARYLLTIAMMLMLHNGVKTTGEYLLSHAVRASAVAAVGSTDVTGVQRTVGAFYSSFYAYVNTLGLFFQLLIVSRVVRYLGVPIAILILPLMAMTGYGVIAFVPLLEAVFVAKVGENATDYSLDNTVRNMLFLPCTTEEKYAAKQAIDSFFVRLGDVLAAAIVFVGTTWLSLGSQGFALVNVGLVGIWLVLAWHIGRAYRAQSSATDRAGIAA
jgi:AAA family ATP:ADP antiporter